MENIWGFFLQTVSVTAVAGLLLLVKWLLEDKLSPRWQYGIWSVLVLRILLPVNTASYVLPGIPLRLETWKALAEKGLDSAYTQVYRPVGLRHVFPVFGTAPQSVTDWLFVIYGAGVAISLAWYLASYMCLRLRLRGGKPASAALEEKIDQVCRRYSLMPCRAVEVPELDSAFVCGVFRPILAVPADRELDEKVILHELLHKRYLDSLQSFFWCFLRCLHWCNPLMHLVFRRIGDDMEALCDQRVLERLEGEDRRAYGKILLDMANTRYARAPGTTSISNGGKQISRRIQAIVRFKKYPRGMALVSVCLVIVLGCPAIVGVAQTFDQDLYYPGEVEDMELSLAMTRLNRCTTVAGALDTYAKGRMLQNGIFITMVSPLSDQEDLEAQMRYNCMNDGWVPYHLDAGYGLEYVDLNKGYQIYNLAPAGDGEYEALLVFGVFGFLDKDGHMAKDETGEVCHEGFVAIPVTVRLEDAWIVEETGERILCMGAMEAAEDLLPKLWQQTVEAQTGTVTVGISTVYSADNSKQSTGTFWQSNGVDTSPKPDAEFDSLWIYTSGEYTCRNNATGKEPEESLGLYLKALDSMEETVELSQARLLESGGGSSSDGEDWQTCLVSENWDGAVRLGSGTGQYGAIGGEPVELPKAYQVWLFWDGELVEELKIPVPVQP